LFWQLREYSVPVLFAVLLHAAAVAALYSGWQPQKDTVRMIKPQIVNSTLLVLEPKARPKPPPPPPKVSQPEPAPQEAEITPEVKPQVDPAVARREAEAAARLREAQQQARLRALADSSFVNALADETSALEEGAAAADIEIAQSYRFGIYQLVVANWSRPPSARNGMEATLQVDLVPTGDVVSVTLIQGSGSSAFDRSAEAAVRKARRFEVPVESALFEKYFRRFILLFKPEDLLR